jgi:hypothetical protein
MRNGLIGAALFGAVLLGTVAAAHVRSAAPDVRCFELRTYTVSPGKFDVLHRRFQEHALPLFKKHGMTVVGFWVAQDKPDTLVYVLAHPSRPAAEAAWKAFREDPEWVAAKADSERDGSLTSHVESVFMTPTGYSPLK